MTAVMMIAMMVMMMIMVIVIIAAPPEGVAQVSPDVFLWHLLITVIHLV